MTNKWGTGKQSSKPEPIRLGAEQNYRNLAAASLTALAVTSLIDGTTRLEVPRGVYAGLAALFLAGFVGSLVGLLRTELQRLRTEVAALRKELRDGRRAAGGYAAPSIDPDTAAAVGRLGLRLIGGQSNQ